MRDALAPQFEKETAPHVTLKNKPVADASAIAGLPALRPRRHGRRPQRRRKPF
jgi:hypothetical protein